MENVEYSFERRQRIQRPNVIASIFLNKYLWAIGVSVTILKTLIYFLQVNQQRILLFVKSNLFEVVLLSAGMLLIGFYWKRKAFKFCLSVFKPEVQNKIVIIILGSGIICLLSGLFSLYFI